MPPDPRDLPKRDDLSIGAGRTGDPAARDLGLSAGAGRTAGGPTDAEVQALAPGTTLSGRYTVRALLGAGGMGAVYRVFDRLQERDVALKLVLPSLLAREKALERFKNEARIMLGLTHPGIVRVFDVGEDEARGLRFYTMELLEGMSLRAWLEAKKQAQEAADPKEALEIVRQILEALKYAHEVTVHRDLKPENIFLLADTSGAVRVKILDFGIAKLQSSSQFTATSMALGTAYYMAPEQQLDAAKVDRRADLYSVSVILYEMLTGQLPVGRFKTPSEERRALPRALDEVVLRGLEGRPEERQQTAERLLADVAAIRAALERGPRARGRGGRRAAVLAVLAIAVGALAVAARERWWVSAPAPLVMRLRVAPETPIADAGTRALLADRVLARLAAAGVRFAETRRDDGAVDLAFPAELAEPELERVRGALAVAGRLDIRFVAVAFNSENRPFRERATGLVLDLEDPAVIPGLGIASAHVILDSTGPPAIAVETTNEGRAALARATSTGVGRRLAILLDGVVITAPVLREPLADGRFQISGNFAHAEAEALTRALGGEHAYPVPVRVLRLDRPEAEPAPTPRPIAAPRTIERPNAIYTVLENGLEVVIEERKGAPDVHCRVVVKAGSLTEREPGSGLSHFVAELLTEGKSTARGWEATRKLLQSMSARANATTDPDAMWFSIDVPAPEYAQALDLLAEWMTKSAPDPSLVAVLRERILREIETATAEGHGAAWQLFLETAYPGHPLAAPIFGAPEQVAARAAPDLAGFYRERYVPNDAIVVVVGDVAKADALARVKAAFGAWERRPLAAVERPVPEQTAERRAERESASQESMAIAGWRTVGARDPDSAALGLLASVLEDRLKRALLGEKRIAKGLGVRQWSVASFPGELMVGCVAADRAKLEEALAAVFAEAARLHDPLGAEDFEGARKAFAAERARSLEGNAGRAALFAEAIGRGVDPFAFDEAYRAVLALATPEDLARLARKHLVDERRTVAIVTPKAERGWFDEKMPAGMRRGSEKPVYLFDTGKALEIEMVYVPPGDFIMGAEDADAYEDEKPRRTVPMAKGYYIARCDTTWKEYRVFCTATARAEPPAPDAGADEDHPVANVDWADATAFCEWAGLRLPTEVEWEKAARGTDGRKYPWGDDPPTPERCVFEDHPQYGKKSTAPVGSCPAGASPYGALDMAGNVWQWCAFEDAAAQHVLRGGGAWAPARQCRTSMRTALEDAHDQDTGFRPAKSAD